MRLERGAAPAGDDAALTAALRALYAAPTDAAYWRELEARVLARLREADVSPVEWWAVFDGWVGAGLAAAALVAALLGAAVIRSHDGEAQLAYESEIEAPSGVPLAVQSASQPASAAREATLRYLISH